MQFQDLVLNTLVWSSELALIAIGMSLTYALVRFANFAHVEYATTGAYLTYSLHIGAGLGLIFSAILAMFAVGFIAVAINELIFARLTKASPVAKMVVSVALAMIIRTVLSMIYSTKARSLDYVASPIFEGFRLTDLQFAITATAVVAVLLFHFGLQRTSLGKALRATADQPGLAESRGVDTARVTRWMWFVAGAFAALGGTLIALETQLRPVIGQFLIMPMFAAATVGGLGSAYGALVGAFILALAQNLLLGINFGPLFGHAFMYISASYKDAVALLVLVFTLLIRPQGLFGRRGPR